MLSVLLIFVNFQLGLTMIFPKGIVHYTLNEYDYDENSQNIITSTMAALQREVCLKFFRSPVENNATEEAKVLYIHNPDKTQECDFQAINFTKYIVDMRIGYKCLNTADVGRMLSSMIITGIQLAAPVVNSEDLKKKFDDEERKQASDRGTDPSLLAPSDRNYINQHYVQECGSLAKPAAGTRRVDPDKESIMTGENIEYYKDKLWPMGVIIYNIEDMLRKTPLHAKLEDAMAAIELSSCIVFQDMPADDYLVPRSMLYFGLQGAVAPKHGFSEENQTISLWSMINGDAGHTSHTLNLLLRALGIPMMSNRHDRDNYITVHWNNVAKGKEHNLERLPSAAWIRDGSLPYDFESVTHAPANYMCEHCNNGSSTVTPEQEHLWQRTMTMGRSRDLSAGDRELLKLLYGPQCQQRYVRDHS